MRDERTPVESIALKSLIDMLNEVGHQVVIDDSITDSPDAVLIIDGIRTAIECRYLLPSEILELIGRNSPNHGEIVEVAVPLEPHLWVEKAIASKKDKILKYRKNSDSERVWLLLHTSKHYCFNISTLGDKRPEVDLLYYGANSLDHDFDRIFIFDFSNHDCDKNAVGCIYGDGIQIRDVDPQEYIDSFKPSYPMVNIITSGAVATENEEGKCSLKINFNNVLRRVTAQPLNKKYKIDYSSLEDEGRWDDAVLDRYIIYDGKVSL